jgi:hypothetical protein
VIRRTALLVALLALGCAACAAVLGFDRLSEDGATDAGDSDVVTPPQHPDASGGVCGQIGVDDPPDASADASPDAPAAVLVAVKTLDLGIDAGEAIPGFNLDRTCSVDVTTSSCTTGVDEVTFDKYAKDHGDRGLDNTGYGLIQYLGSLGDAFKPSSVNDRLLSGEFGILVRITNWNGASDDDDVFVEAFPAVGIVVQGDAGTKPQITSSDQWIRDVRFQVAPGLDASILKSNKAYVTGNKLVASFADFTLPITVPDDPKKLDIRAREVWLEGDLVTDASGTRIANATLGGRWKTADFLGEVRLIYLKSTLGVSMQYLCEMGAPAFIYATVKKEACSGRDIRSASREDDTNVPCDALSVGLRLDTYAVDKAGPFLPGPAFGPRCQDAGVPEGDDCTTN